MTIELQSIQSASNDKVTAMLVNAILTDNHEDAKVAQQIIGARGSLNQVTQYQTAVTDIASGLSVGGIKNGIALG